MNFKELKLILVRLFREYVKKHIKRILIALILSIIVAASTSGIAWLLDPAVKKIFIEQDRTLAWAIPLLIIIAFSQRAIFIFCENKYYQKWRGGFGIKKVAKNILLSDIETLENRHSGKYISALCLMPIRFKTWLAQEF